MTNVNDDGDHRNYLGAGLCSRIAPSTRRLCRRRQEPWYSREMPNPRSCRRHWTDEELTAATGGSPQPPRETAEQQEAREEARLALEPACWSWPVPAETVLLLARYHEAGDGSDALELVTMRGRALRAYDQGRCAVCGRLGNEVEDHDHETGLVRGWLCRSCNTSEGRNRFSGGIWARYRLHYPYLILGITEQYTGGWGWQDGGSYAEWFPKSDDPWRNNPMAGAFD